MRCPRCSSTVSSDATHCPGCSYDLTIYQSLNRMKDDLGRIKADASSLSRTIDRLESRFGEIEDLIPQSLSKPEISTGKSDEQPQEPEADFFPSLEDALAEGPEQEIPSQKQAPPIAPPPLSDRTKQKTPARSVKPGESEINFGQKWLLIAGVVLTVLALGWFLKYSFDKNWIGPIGRVSMAYLLGMAFLGGGEVFRRRDFHVFGLYLIGGGIASLYFATFAAFQIYHLLSQVPAFGLMIVITTLAGILALVYDTKWLAVLGLVGGFITPVVLSTGTDNQVAMMTYMTILNTGILSIAFFKQWRLLSYLGFLLTWLLFSGWYFNYYMEYKFWTTTVFLNIFFLTYALAPFVYHIVKEHGTKLRGIEITMPNAFIAFAYSFAMISDRYQVEFVSIVSIAYALIFFLMSRFVYSRDHEQLGAFVMMISKATLFLVLTVPILFSRHWITFFWAIQAGVLLWAALKLKSKWLYISFVIILSLATLKFFLYDYSEVFRLRFPAVYFRSGYTRLLLERLLTSATILASVFLSLRLRKKFGNEMGLFREKDTTLLQVVFGIILFLMLNIEVGAFFHDYASQARFAAISVLWALFSIVMMVLGFLKVKASLRQCAIGLFGITLIKVFFVDMSNVSTPYRVVSFMILGIMLIGASYLYHRYKDHILPTVAEERSGP